MNRAQLIALAIALLPMPAFAVDVAALVNAADGGDVSAQTRLGTIYMNGKGVTRDYALALRYFGLAARSNDPAAMNGLGDLYEYGWGVPIDYHLAFNYRSAAAKAGLPRALNDLGYMYYNGHGVPRDYQAAFQYYSRAALAGSTDGISHLGYLYSNGIGVPRDYSLAFKYFSQAAEAGNSNAITNLGQIYEFGRGVPQDYNLAVKYYTQAAKLNNPVAQCDLGRMYKSGKGVPQDVVRATALFMQSAENGYAAAYFNLGLMLRDGLDGVPVNLELANAAFKAAVEHGYSQAASFIVKAAPVLSSAARDFLPVADDRPPPPPSTRATGAKVSPGPRLALVIANGAYAPNLNTLNNPVNDGRLIASALIKTGFKVTQRYDLNVIQMKDALATFADALRAAGPNTTALFFYAGHGAAAAGVNYLIPVGAPIKNLTGLQTYGQSADAVLDLLDGAKPTTTIVILDACRNVPFSGARGSEGGLAQMSARNGSIIAYSTAPGKTAADGDGDDSPYAKALATTMRQSSEPLEILFRRVRAQVADETQNAQTPWESTSLRSEFAFVPR